MFTGLIREIAEVISFQGNQLCLKARYRPKIGDSIAINGACLSVTSLLRDGFCVQLSEETRSKIAMENLQQRVHIEPAMQLTDRLEGHIVQGHIDAIGVIERIVKKANSTDFYIALDPKPLRFIIPKGSVAIDGVSLTVNEVFSWGFRLSIIPITLQKTLLGSYAIGRRVNIETDMFARYLYYLFKGEKSLSWEEVERMQALF